ncbi:MAG: hypothetical protein ACK5LT_11560 [Lachnospirales bacterium]
MYNRHDVIFLSGRSREKILKEIEVVHSDVENIVMNEKIPAIVSRQYKCKDGCIYSVVLYLLILILEIG